MVIQHNMQSIFANRQLNMTTGRRAQASAKLSSGYRINIAADAAAGLKISEKMRSQIRGLNRAADNIQDGVSLLNVADSALEEIGAMMQRQRELLVQGANDTNTVIDRDAIQAELDELTREADRVFSDTTFNRIHIFKRSEIVLNEYDESDYNSGIVFQTDVGKDAPGSDSYIVKLYSESDAQSGTDYLGRPIYETRQKTTETTYTTDWDTVSTTKSYMSYITTHVIEHQPDYIMIQAGANSNEAICIKMYDLSASDFYLDTIDVSDYNQAGASIANIDEAQKQLNGIRSYLGAMTNRLEHAYDIDINTSENTQSSESKLRDTDMASTMVQYSKENILMQATQSIWAQANSSQDSLISMLNSL